MGSNILDFKAAKPDPRVLLVQILLVSVLCFSLGRLNELIAVFLLADISLMVQGKMAKAFRALCIYFALILGNALLLAINIPVVTLVYAMMLALCSRLYPIYVSCIVLFDCIPMNELITSLEKSRIPKTFIIPVTVVYRYIPTIKDEIGHIIESMKMRGFHTSLLGFVLHPMAMLENVMVPLLIRSGKIADELSAASVCKGLDAETKRTSLVEVRIERGDMIYFAACILCFVLMLWIHAHNILAF